MNQTEPLETFVARQLELGTFKDYESLVEHALRLYQEREYKRQLLRDAILPAMDALDRGEGVPLDMDEIIARGEKRLTQTASTKG